LAGTRDAVGVYVEARDNCLELLDTRSATGVAIADFFADVRRFGTVGLGAGLETGSALERMLEKAIGSAGLLGVESSTAGFTGEAFCGSCLTIISCFTSLWSICDPPPIFMPFCRRPAKAWLPSEATARWSFQLV